MEPSRQLLYENIFFFELHCPRNGTIISKKELQLKTLFLHHLAIHPSIHFPLLIRVVVEVKQCRAYVVFLCHILQLFLRDPEAFLGHIGYVIPPACSESALWSPPQLDVPGIPLQGGIHPYL